ncbi:UDP-3-O-(3-hydroxymyristoyl)glucosamine N-acyltransferase [Flammeovirga pacifica]|uniref:UDP-3-O-(3-hydroxymyristoyl)glucosamine N-acyltransferase n=1 Tax=Flammeovirga pacifica TaxID=915059 RepID=UPI0026AB7007|nr:UDP-3-O-(3-hydroxymyristoyl)glucosamine N-acyltransferase [Flammeovirga pacifica]
MKLEITVQQIAMLLQGEVVGGDANAKVSTIAKIQEGEQGAISFLANMKYEEFIYSTKVSAVIVSKSFEPKQEVPCAMIVVEDAYAGFTDLLTEYQRMLSLAKVGIEQPAFIDESVDMDKATAYVGAFTYISRGVKIGKNVKIHPQVFIGEGVEIGDNCVLYAGVKICHGSKLGNNCTLQAGAVIGSDGFGFAPQKDGTYKTIPQIGNVILEDNVDVGANTVVDRATMGSTILKKGVKLDNLIQIAHNVVVGANTVIASQTGVSGSSEIGENCMIGGQVGVSGHIKIADRTMVAAQSGLAQGLEKPGTRIMGSPAIPSIEHLKSFAVYRKLPELQRIVRDLEKKVLSL